MRLRKSDMSLVKTILLYDFENLAKKRRDQAFYYINWRDRFKLKICDVRALQKIACIKKHLTSSASLKNKNKILL